MGLQIIYCINDSMSHCCHVTCELHAIKLMFLSFFLKVCVSSEVSIRSVLRMGAVKGEGALDGGWGWMIVVASFMAQFLSFGSPQSVGVLYPKWLSAFQEGKGMTAWVGSMVSGVALITSEY